MIVLQPILVLSPIEIRPDLAATNLILESNLTSLQTIIFPFCVKMCREFTREEIRLRDKIKIENYYWAQ